MDRRQLGVILHKKGNALLRHQCPRERYREVSFKVSFFFLRIDEVGFQGLVLRSQALNLAFGDCTAKPPDESRDTRKQTNGDPRRAGNDS